MKSVESIPQKPQPLKRLSHWQQELKTLCTNPRILLQQLEIDENELDWLNSPQFPLRVSQHFISLMEKRNAQDPLLRQVLSLQEESLLADGYIPDPLEENAANPLPGVLHKFTNRILLTITQACPIHCRYCFRRHFPYQNNQVKRNNWPKIVEYIKAHPKIEEIILSGGDPLMLTDEHLSWYLKKIDSLSQIKAIRLHTRMPVIIPTRIDHDLLSVLSMISKPIVIVLHINHPNEICPALVHSLKGLKNTGVTLLNQSVLLKNINDDPKVLTELCWKLIEVGVLPYYIHLLDKVQGAQHFDIPLKRAIQIEKTLIKELPGYCIPKFVKEVPGSNAKVSLEKYIVMKDTC